MEKTVTKTYWQQLPAEEILLLFCARTQISGDMLEQMRDLGSRIDWRRFLQLTYHHGVTAFIYPNIKQYFASTIPDDMLVQLKRYALANTHSNLGMLRELIIVNQLLQEEKIEFGIFKGLAVMQMVYGDLSVRRCGDIDILVKKRDFLRAKTLFLSQGFEQTLSNFNEMLSMQSGLWHEQRHLKIDLHWGIPPHILNIKTRKILDSLSSLSIDGRKLPSFSPEDMFIILCVNATKEYWNQFLYPYCDIHEFLQRGNLNWDFLFVRAEKLSCLRPMKVALSVVEELFGLSPPSAIESRLRLEKETQHVKQELIRQLFSNDANDSGAVSSSVERRPYYFSSDDDYFVALMDRHLKRIMHPLIKRIIPPVPDKSIFIFPESLSFLKYLIGPCRKVVMKLKRLVK